MEFYTSGRQQRGIPSVSAVRPPHGTNNFPDCSNMCHEASGWGLIQSVGVGKGTVVLDDFDAAKAIFVFGQNPAPNHPRMMNALAQRRRARVPDSHLQQPQRGGARGFASPPEPGGAALTPAATHHQPPVPRQSLAATWRPFAAWRNTSPRRGGPPSIRLYRAAHRAHFDEYLAKVKATSGRR